MSDAVAGQVEQANVASVNVGTIKAGTGPAPRHFRHIRSSPQLSALPGAYGGVCLVADQALSAQMAMECPELPTRHSEAITAGAMETMSFTGCSLALALA